MAKNIRRIAKLLGAQIGPKVPDTGGGAFGAARLAQIVSNRLRPSRGLRPGRPAVPGWTHRPKIPMSPATQRKLERLAREASRSGRKVTPMQLAAQLLEEAVAQCPQP